MTPSVHILFCDDDRRFALSMVSQLEQALAARLPNVEWHLTPVASLASLHKIASQPTEAQQWQIIFCDLGWGDWHLEGIRLLHDMQMQHPHIVTVLYTAQDANHAVDQAMEWELHFIDHVVRIEAGSTFLDDAVTIITNYATADEMQFADDVSFTAAQYFPDKERQSIIDQLALELKRVQRSFYSALQQKKGAVALDVRMTPNDIQVHVRPDPSAERNARLANLIRHVQDFPRIAPHDLLALSKSAYIQFIQKTYGGFPQMAKARGLDLNNIYRVNRRFKNAPFVVFKCETIEEIVGIPDAEARRATIQTMLCPPQRLRRAMAA